MTTQLDEQERLLIGLRNGLIIVILGFWLPLCTLVWWLTHR